VTWQRGTAAACAGTIAFCLAYVAVDYLKLPRLVYEPVTRELSMGLPEGPVAMAYVGLWLWASLAGFAVAGVTWLALGARKVGDGALALLTAWAATAFVVAGAYHAWHNWP
jgi:hypothetical protein